MSCVKYLHYQLTILTVGMSSVTLEIGLFHLLVTDCFMCHIVIVDRYKYRWLRWDSLRVCNEFPLSSYIIWTQHWHHLTSALDLWKRNHKKQNKMLWHQTSSNWLIYQSSSNFSFHFIIHSWLHSYSFYTPSMFSFHMSFISDCIALSTWSSNDLHFAVNMLSQQK